MSVSKAAVKKHTQNRRKNLRNLKNIAFIEFLEFFWTECILFYQMWLNITQDVSRNAKIAFNFLPDFNNVMFLCAEFCVVKFMLRGSSLKFNFRTWNTRQDFFVSGNFLPVREELGNSNSFEIITLRSKVNNNSGSNVMRLLTKCLMLSSFPDISFLDNVALVFSCICFACPAIENYFSLLSDC